MCTVDSRPLLDEVAKPDNQLTRKWQLGRSMLSFAWSILVFLVSTCEELWVVILFVSFGWANELLPCLTFAALFASCSSIPLVYVIFMTCYQKIRVLWGGDDYIRFMSCGDDFWPPLPNYEWGGAPLNIKLVAWDQKKGWDGEMHGLKADEETNLCEQDEEGLQAFDSDIASKHYEEEYIARQNKISEPTLAMNICYLLEQNNNSFLFESMEWFTSAFTCPIYLVMNARGEERTWVHDKVCEVKKSLLMKHRGQVQ
eukprot:scaffold83236_cov36-Cyclotella_meneghiniana.AAC.4